MNLLLVGLGNPGRQYDETRHNVGFDFIEHLSKKLNLPLKKGMFLPAEVGRGITNGNKIVLVRPQTFMNNSGDIFPKIFKQTDLSLENLLVICDNMDLPVGEARLKLKGSSGGQKGLKSITAHLGTENFMRLFIGIGRPFSREGVVDWVLGHPSSEDKKAINEVTDFIIDRLLQIDQKGMAWVINEINSHKCSE